MQIIFPDVHVTTLHAVHGKGVWGKLFRENFEKMVGFGVYIFYQILP